MCEGEQTSRVASDCCRSQGGAESAGGEGVADPEEIARSARERYAFDMIVVRILGVYTDILVGR